MIKKITLLLAFSFLLGACSSGTSVSDLPPNLGGGPFTGTFQSNKNTDRGTITFNLTQDGTDVSGLIVVDGGNTPCLRSGSVEGSVNGFNVNLEITQVIPTITTDGDGNTTTSSDGATLRMALIGNNNSLNGSYTVEGELNSNCTADDSSGTVSATR